MFPTTVDDNGVIIVMIEFTAAVLLVIGISVILFARWSKREKARREKQIGTAIDLNRKLS